MAISGELRPAKSTRCATPDIARRKRDGERTWQIRATQGSRHRPQETGIAERRVASADPPNAARLPTMRTPCRIAVWHRRPKSSCPARNKCRRKASLKAARAAARFAAAGAPSSATFTLVGASVTPRKALHKRLGFRFNGTSAGAKRGGGAYALRASFRSLCSVLSGTATSMAASSRADKCGATIRTENAKRKDAGVEHSENSP